jgi:4-hydroxybenzoate polyprenyltransferase
VNPTLINTRSGLSELKLFLALSRTPHGLLDMATPALAALLWLGSFPPPGIVALGLISAIAGYTAVYALNDLVDYRVDARRVADRLLPDIQNDLDGIFIRHPLAYGLLSFPRGLLWTAAWAAVALIGSYLLNPVCAAIFLVSGLLEALYCLLWKTTWLKLFISGAVKTSGAMAAVFAVDPEPALLPLLLLFLWLFFWEIGGQNVPNDWADIVEDRTLRATTIPVRFGPAAATRVICISLFLAVVLSGLSVSLSPAGSRFAGIAASFAAGITLMIIPAYRLCRTRGRTEALALFNGASYYPLTLLAAAVIAACT